MTLATIAVSGMVYADSPAAAAEGSATGYNRPDAPDAQPFSRTTDCYKACSSPAAVRAVQPTLTAKVSSPNRGNLKTTFVVRTSPQSNGPYVTGSGPVVTASPGIASWRVNKPLTPGATYYWTAQSVDENNLGGPWSAYQTFTIDTTAPTAPKVSSAQYPEKAWGATVGTPGLFELTSSGDIAEYAWSVAGGPTGTVTAGPVSYTPAKDMVQVMRVSAVDVAGNRSPNTDYQFWVSPLPNRCWNWRLDEKTGTRAAESGNTDTNDPVCGPIGEPVEAQPGTLSGSVAFGPGYVNNAAVFSGNGQIKTAGPVLDTRRSFTVMAWVRPSALTGTRVAISQDGQSGSLFTLGYRDNANGGVGGWCFELLVEQSPDSPLKAACATGSVGDSVTPAVNQWVHLGGVYDALTGEIQVHVMGNQASCNGEMAKVSARAGDQGSAGSFVIGRAQTKNAAASSWQGTIDHVYAHQRVLSTAEICQQAMQ